MIHSYDLLTAVNNEEVYRRNLLSSPDLGNDVAHVHAVRDAISAGEAYNRLLEQGTAPIAIFAHQDVYLPQGWFRTLDRLLSSLPLHRWGVVGVWGISEQGTQHGLVWCNSVGRILDRGQFMLQPAVSLDEMLLIVNRDANLTFDDTLPGFHLYGTDLVLTAQAQGLRSYAIRNPTIHNCRTWIHLDKAYRAAYRHLQKKWRTHLPLPTCIVRITPTGWPLLHRSLTMRVATLRKRRVPTVAVHDPHALARQLGWESPSVSGST